MSKISLEEFTTLVALMLATHTRAELYVMIRGKRRDYSLDYYVLWGATRKSIAPSNLSAFLQVYNRYIEND